MRRRVDAGALVAGLVLAALGGVLGLAALDVVRLGFGWLAPLLAGAVGAMLLAAGLGERGP